MWLKLMEVCSHTLGCRPYVRPISSGSQSFAPSPTTAPIGQAVPKIEGLSQASGETKYTSDLTLPSGCLFASPVLATRETGTRFPNQETSVIAPPFF